MMMVFLPKYTLWRKETTWRCFFVLFVTLLLSEVHALMAGAIIVPHGDFAFDPTLTEPWSMERRVAEDIAKASRQAGAWMANQVQPTIIVLSTPHGIKLDFDFSIFMGHRGSGFATIGNDQYNKSKLYNVTVQVDLAPTIAEGLLATLKRQKGNVSGFYSFTDDMDLPLQWGEIIPLLMIPGSVNGNGPPRQHLIWSHPKRRYDHAPDMVPELLRLGNYIRTWAEEQRSERIGVVISADLAHTHQPQGPYGYSNASGPFDAAIGHWASNPCQNSASLLTIAASLERQALCCGFTGLVLLHGMLCSGTEAPIPFQPTLLVNANVTYYGMMAATFDRISDKQ